MFYNNSCYQYVIDNYTIRVYIAHGNNIMKGGIERVTTAGVRFKRTLRKDKQYFLFGILYTI
jgi:hypothetical protein